MAVEDFGANLPSLGNILTWNIIELLLCFVFFWPEAYGDTTSSSSVNTPDPTIEAEQTTTPVTGAETTSFRDPFNKVAGSVLVCIGIPFVSFIGLKLFGWLFPECCKKSDFKRIFTGIKTGLKECFCPQTKTNVVAPTISKGIDLFTRQNTKDERGEGGHDYLRMYISLQKTTNIFNKLLKEKDEVRDGAGRRHSNTSLETIDGHIITTSADIESDENTWLKLDDKFRSASRSPTPPPDVVVIYPDGSSPNLATAAEFRPIKTAEDETLQDDGSNTAGLEQHQTVVEIALPPNPPPPKPSDTHNPIPKLPYTQHLENSNGSQNDQDTARRKSPLDHRSDSSSSGVAVSPRALTSGQSGNIATSKQSKHMLTRTNTRSSMCIIRIELPERTEPDGMEAPGEPPDIDGTSYLTAVSTNYRGESDGGEDFGEMTAEDSFYIQPIRLADLYSKPPADLNNSMTAVDPVDRPSNGLSSNTEKPINIVRKGSYGCEAITGRDVVIPNAASVNATVFEQQGGEQLVYLSSPCSTFEENKSSNNDGGHYDIIDDDSTSDYTISCPSSNGTPMTSQMNTPQCSPLKKIKHDRIGTNPPIHEHNNSDIISSITQSDRTLSHPSRSDMAVSRQSIAHNIAIRDSVEESQTSPSKESDVHGKIKKNEETNKQGSADNERTQNMKKSSTAYVSRRKNSLHTGVYSSPSNRRVVTKSRTYVTTPQLMKSNSSSSANSSSSDLRNTESSSSLIRDFRDSHGPTLAAPARDSHGPTQAAPTNENVAVVQKQELAASKKETGVSKRDLGSPERVVQLKGESYSLKKKPKDKQATSAISTANLPPPPTSYKSNVSNASALYTKNKSKKKASQKIKAKLVKK